MFRNMNVVLELSHLWVEIGMGDGIARDMKATFGVEEGEEVDSWERMMVKLTTGVA